MMKGQFRFCLKASQSPTHFHLCRYLKAEGWKSCCFNWLADFSDENLNFNCQAAQQLEFKHLLAKLVAKHCPKLMPLTYCIDDQNWPDVLNKVAVNHYMENNRILNQINDLVWILKPALLNNGKGIKIFDKLSALEQHFLSSQRIGGEHVLQLYLTQPHLLRDKRKYSIRMFVILTNYAGCYLYPYGYYNVALEPYREKDFRDLRSHLTNEHLKAHEANVLQIPTEQFSAFASHYEAIKSHLTAVISGLKKEHPQAFICQSKRTLAIFGFDFLVDNQGRLWLIEANHGPCFPLHEEHPLQLHLYKKFWQNLIHYFVFAIAENQTKYLTKDQSFELLT